MTAPPTSAYSLPSSDLDQAIEMVDRHWSSLQGMELFFTGGTGFVGTWMVAVLLHAIDKGVLSARVHLLTRDPERFAARSPTIARHPSVALVGGDVLRDGWSMDGCSHLVAGATEASAVLLKENPRLMLETIVDGTRRTLDLAGQAGVSRSLFISSGAANGPQPPQISQVRESDFFGPDPLLPRSAYAEGKRAAEMLFTLSKSAGFSFSVARLWAFVGPLLPLDAHFAVGNFIGDALAKRTISILGDGTAVRSYQYASEMAAWSWIVLAAGRDATAYNVGSPRSVSTRELAALVDRIEEGAGFEVLGKPDPTRPLDSYVPSIDRFRTEFGIGAPMELETALAKTLAWNRSGNGLQGFGTSSHLVNSR